MRQTSLWKARGRKNELYSPDTLYTAASYSAECIGGSKDCGNGVLRAKHPNDWLKWGSTINSNAEHNQNPALSVDKALLNYTAFLSSQINTPSD